jgi:K+-sensing histidine kinase KdpD
LVAKLALNNDQGLSFCSSLRYFSTSHVAFRCRTPAHARFPAGWRHRRDIEFVSNAGSRADEAGVYSVSLSQPRLRFGWFALQPTRCPKYQAGVEAVDVKSKLDITPASDADPLFGPGASQAMRYLASIAMTALATVVAVGADSKVTIPNLSLVFVVPVIVAGVSLGLGPSLCSAILGALAFNFFLTEPRYSLAVDDPANIWAIGLLFLVGLIASGVAFTSHRRAAEAALLRRQATVLQGYSRDLVAADNMTAIVSITSQALAALFQVPVVVMLVTDDRVVLLERAGDVEPQEADLEAARSSLATGTAMRSGIYPNLASRFDFWPVKTAEGRNAVIGLAFDPDERPASPDTLVDIVVSVLALVLDRQHARAGRPAR